MKTIYVIKDILTEQYFWTYRANDGFSENFSDATIFDSEEDAVKEMKKDYLSDLFLPRFIEIKKLYSFG